MLSTVHAKQAAIPSVMDLEQITITAPRSFHIRMDFRLLRWYTARCASR